MSDHLRTTSRVGASMHTSSTSAPRLDFGADPVAELNAAVDRQLATMGLKPLDRSAAATGNPEADLVAAIERRMHARPQAPAARVLAAAPRSSDYYAGDPVSQLDAAIDRLIRTST